MSCEETFLEDTKKDVQEILTQKEDFIIIGLTGRMGSGCSSIADILAMSFDELNIPHPIPQPGSASLSEAERLERMIYEYGNVHWLKFEILKVRSVISSFLLTQSGTGQFVSDIKSLGVSTKDDEQVRKDFACELLKDFQNSMSNWSANLDDEFENLSRQIKKVLNQDEKCSESIRMLDEAFEKSRAFEVIQKELGDEDKSKAYAESLDMLYRCVHNKELCESRREYIEKIDKFLELLSERYILRWMQEYGKNHEVLWNRLVEISREFPNKYTEGRTSCPTEQPNANEATTAPISQFEKYIYVKYLSEWFGNKIHDYLNSLNPGAFTRLFQKYGQMIRDHGTVVVEDSPSKSGDIFEIPRKLNRYIKVLRHPFHTSLHRPVRVAVDSIKNIFEATYLRYRYSAFYLWGVTAKDDVREERLRRKHLNDLQIKFMDWNEYPAEGREAFLAGLKESGSAGVSNSNEYEFYNDAFGSKRKTDEHDSYREFRRKAYKEKLYTFIMQDVESCMDNADVFILTEGGTETEAAAKNAKLKVNILRNVLLVMYPCLVRPTSVERCMQIAFSAKVNSGCLSRQVGAVVTDSKYNILAIGWNDVPKGETPCAYRNLLDVVGEADSGAYSKFENTNADFRRRATALTEYISCWNKDYYGLPCSYCFKDVHQKGKDAMRSRAMHAEEKALALCGDKAEGGYLFTTSSPCEMCSKNAKNHGIKKIFYIESYPGIAADQYTESGDPNNRAELILFTGAVGRAYMQMYTPLMPHKDILAYMGFDPHSLLNKT